VEPSPHSATILIGPHGRNRCESWHVSVIHLPCLRNVAQCAPSKRPSFLLSTSPTALFEQPQSSYGLGLTSCASPEPSPSFSLSQLLAAIPS
jgi:hypothetical protein